MFKYKYLVYDNIVEFSVSNLIYLDRRYGKLHLLLMTIHGITIKYAHKTEFTLVWFVTSIGEYQWNQEFIFIALELSTRVTSHGYYNSSNHWLFYSLFFFYSNIKWSNKTHHGCYHWSNGRARRVMRNSFACHDLIKRNEYLEKKGKVACTKGYTDEVRKMWMILWLYFILWWLK